MIERQKEEMKWMKRELTHAKKTLVEYIRTCNTLEQVIEENRPIEESDLVLKLWHENQRLNSENEGLIEIKKEIESELTSQIQDLYWKLEKSQQETHIVSKEYDILWEKLSKKEFD